MNTFNEDRQHPDMVPGLRREWMILSRRRRLIVATTALSVAVAALYNYSARPLYDGVAIVSAGEAVPGQPNARLNGDLPRLRIVIDKEIARITSREFAARIVNGATPAQKAELANGPLGSWYRRLRFGWGQEAKAGTPLNTGQAVAALRSRLRLDWKEPSTWIDIRVAGYDPDAVADLANAVVNLYVSETADANRQTIEDSRTAFEVQVENRERHLGEQLSGLRDLGKETGLGDLGGRKATLERQIRALQEALASAQTARVGRAATTREATQLEGSDLLAASDPRIQAAQTRLLELEDREHLAQQVPARVLDSAFVSRTRE